MKNSEEIERKVKEIEKNSTLRLEIIEEIVDEDLKTLKKETLESRVLNLASDIKSLNYEEFRQKLIDAYTEMLPFGYCHIFWSKKKVLLKERYNIDWFTPEEENPEIIFD